jgi:hypothetical protein
MDSNAPITETIINGQYYVEAGEFVTKEESRYSLDALRIEPHPDGGAVIVATDGHTLCVFYDEFATCSEAITIKFQEELVPFLKTAHEWQQSRLRCVRITDTTEILDAQHDHDTGYKLSKLVATFPGGQIESPVFPNWRPVLPTSAPERRIDFNSEYLRRCALNHPYANITMWHTDEEKQAIVRAPNRADFVAIIMPIKMDADDLTYAAYPEYMNKLLPPSLDVTQPTETKET